MIAVKIYQVFSVLLFLLKLIIGLTVVKFSYSLLVKLALFLQSCQLPWSKSWFWY